MTNPEHCRLIRWRLSWLPIIVPLLALYILLDPSVEPMSFIAYKLTSGYKCHSLCKALCHSL
ncbi:hypothetical protein BD560DRAFT_404780 [Blakeslea trispora]|nr:hypothetical protein BD560DRAFT_404780 [Blakeslea trispora]